MLQNRTRCLRLANQVVAFVFLMSFSVTAITDNHVSRGGTDSGLDVAIGAIMDSPAGRKVLERYFGKEVISSQQFAMAKSATIHEIAPFMKGLLSDEQLRQLDADLRNVGLTAKPKVGRKYPKRHREKSAGDGSDNRPTLRDAADDKNIRIGPRPPTEKIPPAQIGAPARGPSIGDDVHSLSSFVVPAFAPTED